MSGKLKILVAGATGQQGGVVARALIGRGHSVRALTRTPSSPAARGLAELGAEVVEGNLDDKRSLVELASGMDAVFGVSTPFEQGTTVEARQGINLVDAAAEAGVDHFVFSSVGSANMHTGIPHFDSKFEVEKHLVASGVPFTIIGPVFFMENWLGPWFLPPLKEGNVALALPEDRGLAQISIEDIGNFSALIFESPDEFLGRRIDIASDSLSGREVADQIGRRVGRKFGFFEIPLDAIREQSDDFARMFQWFDEVGYSVDTDALRRHYPEVGWTPFEVWAARQDWSVLDAVETKAS